MTAVQVPPWVPLQFSWPLSPRLSPLPHCPYIMGLTRVLHNCHNIMLTVSAQSSWGKDGQGPSPRMVHVCCTTCSNPWAQTPRHNSQEASWATPYRKPYSTEACLCLSTQWHFLGMTVLGKRIHETFFLPRPTQLEKNTLINVFPRPQWAKT